MQWKLRYHDFLSLIWVKPQNSRSYTFHNATWRHLSLDLPQIVNSYILYDAGFLLEILQAQSDII